ncbi:cytochrome P450 [Lentzea alba]|uniref:cytochrome P450 family protein n=1 Tax=Lentzea alba TaxID=2714351 RepID=UPI0039BF9CCF
MTHLLDESFFQDAHTATGELRATTPVRHVVLPDGLPAWLVTGYDEAKAVMTDPRFSSHRVYDRLHRMSLGLGEDEETPFSDDLAANLLNLDPPDHTRLRKLVTKAFTSRSVAPLRSRIEQITDELLDAMSGSDTVEVLNALAYPLPIQVICELLGVPFDDRDKFTAWSKTMVDGGTSPEAGQATMMMAGYLNELIAAKRAEPADDLLTELVHVSDGGDVLSQRELVATAVVLLVGGFETTVNLISSGLLALARHPDQVKLLRDDRTLLPGAVEEFLRYETPNNLSSPRYTTEAVRLGDVEIPAGHFVVVSWLAANRDPSRFPGADRLDVTRPVGGHLAFGHGIHFCVGAPLARLEGEVAFGRLLDRFEGIELVSSSDGLRWRRSTSMHGLESLVLRLRSAR